MLRNAQELIIFIHWNHHQLLKFYRMITIVTHKGLFTGKHCSPFKGMINLQQTLHTSSSCVFYWNKNVTTDSTIKIEKFSIRKRNYFLGNVSLPCPHIQYPKIISSQNQCITSFLPSAVRWDKIYKFTLPFPLPLWASWGADYWSTLVMNWWQQ